MALIRGSLSRRATEDVTLADTERSRRGSGGRTFASVRHALTFFFERSEAMQSALGQHPRGQTAPDGSQVFVDVDGGRGGDLDELLATLQTIHAAVVDLHLDSSVRHRLLEMSVRDGLSQTEIAKRSGLSQSTVSAELGRAEGFLLGWLRRAEIVIPGRRDVLRG